MLYSGAIQADLEGTFRQAQEIRGCQGQIAPGFQQAESQIFGGTQALGEHLAEQAALLYYGP
jgi:hypothetical protein